MWIKVKETKSYLGGIGTAEWKSAGHRLVNTAQIFHVDDYAEGILCLYFDQDAIFIESGLDEFLNILNQGRPGSSIETPQEYGVPTGCPNAGSCSGCKEVQSLDPELRSNKEYKNPNTPTNSVSKKPVKAIPVEYSNLAEDFGMHFVSSTGRGVNSGDLSRWAREFMVLAQRLNVTPSKIKDVMDWVYNDDFWAAQVQGIQNLYKLRSGVRKWDNIVAKMNQGGAQSFIDDEVRRGNN